MCGPGSGPRPPIDTSCAVRDVSDATDALSAQRTPAVDLSRPLVFRPVAPRRPNPRLSGRGVATNVFVTVTARNENDVPRDMTFSSDYGSRTFGGVTPERFASHAFNTRSSNHEGGTVTINAHAVIDGVNVDDVWTVEFSGLTC